MPFNRAYAPFFERTDHRATEFTEKNLCVLCAFVVWKKEPQSSKRCKENKPFFHCNVKLNGREKGILLF